MNAVGAGSTAAASVLINRRHRVVRMATRGAVARVHGNTAAIGRCCRCGLLVSGREKPRNSGLDAAYVSHHLVSDETEIEDITT